MAFESALTLSLFSIVAIAFSLFMGESRAALVLFILFRSHFSRGSHYVKSLLPVLFSGEAP